MARDNCKIHTKVADKQAAACQDSDCQLYGKGPKCQPSATLRNRAVDMPTLKRMQGAP